MACATPPTRTVNFRFTIDDFGFSTDFVSPKIQILKSEIVGQLMENSKPLLSVHNLKTYFGLDEGTVKAVDGVSFDVHPGQVVGIVGESGCGKSVTIKSVLRIVEKPGKIVNGEILFRLNSDEEMTDLVKLDAQGRQMRNIRGAEIALIPQEPMAAFSPVHTIGNQLIEAIMLHQPVNKTEARKIAIERLQEVGVPSPEQRIDAYSWELSGGLRQRAMIAMALSCNPKLLIADEPTTAIDVTTQAQVLNLLRKLQQEHNMAIIFITHDLGVIAQISEYVVVMYLGRVMETGPIDDIFHNPQHPYTKALLKSIPTVKSQSRTILPTIEGSIPHPFNRPAGCPFYPRCEEFMVGVCDQRTPTLQPVNNKQSASCFLYHSEAEEA
jgi:oligopeptide/dipeptide ABC transporter ATP-binding protein